MRIQREITEDILNSKLEFGANNLATIELSKGNKIARRGNPNRKREEEEEDPYTPEDHSDQNPEDLSRGETSGV